MKAKAEMFTAQFSLQKAVSVNIDNGNRQFLY